MHDAKLSWIFLACALLAVGWGVWLKKGDPPEPEGEPEWVRREGKLVERVTNEPFQGVQEVPFQQAPAMVQWEYHYVDGVRQGPVTEFYPGPTKKVKMRANLVDGLRQGSVTAYHPNGIKQSEATAVDGEITGIVTSFKTDGTVLKREMFADSLPTGVEAVTTEPVLTPENLATVLSGPEANTEPEIDTATIVDPDELEALEKVDREPPRMLDPAGIPFTGTQIGTFVGGAKAFEHSYQDGREHGAHLAWDPAGNPEYEREFYEGQKHGTWKHWATDQRPISEDTFHYGKQVGTAKRWFPGGEQLRLEGEFVHGAENGTRRAYDRKGREIRQLKFDHGIPTAVIENGEIVSETPVEGGLERSIEAGEEAFTEVIDLDGLPEDFDGIAAVDFRYRLSTDDADSPADASRSFRVTILHAGEVAESDSFPGELGGWRNHEERIEVTASATVKLQIDVPPGDLTLHFAGIRLRDPAVDVE